MGQSGMQLQRLWLYSAGLACLPTPPASPVFPSLPGLSCALCFPSSWVVWEECTAGCGVAPDGPGVLLSWNLPHRGIYTCQSCHSWQMDQTAFPERWAGRVKIQLCRKAWSPPCRLAEVGAPLPSFRSQQMPSPKRKAHFALSLRVSCLPWVLRDLEGFLPL